MNVFLDTSLLLAGLIDLGPQSTPAHLLMHAVAEKTVGPASTAWHCCLEFFSVSTRLPAEFRLAPTDTTLDSLEFDVLTALRAVNPTRRHIVLVLARELADLE